MSVALVGPPGGSVLAGVLPVEGYEFIPGTVLFGVGIPAAAWLSREPAA